MRKPTLPVVIVGPLPSPQDIAARFLALARKQGWLDEAFSSMDTPSGDLEGDIRQANIPQANVGREFSPDRTEHACSGKERQLC